MDEWQATETSTAYESGESDEDADDELGTVMSAANRQLQPTSLSAVPAEKAFIVIDVITPYWLKVELVASSSSLTRV